MTEPTRDAAAITGDDLIARYRRGQAPILDGVSVAVPSGLVTALIGPNGSGKSTLMKTLSRQLALAQGAVRLDGEPADELSTRAFAKRLGILFQENTAPAGLTVAGLVRLGRFPHLGWLEPPGDADDEAVSRALELAGIDALADRRIDGLSGGQRQLVWIAMALAQQTRALLLDEPTTFLDMANQLLVMDVVASLRRRGITVVMVMHDVNLAMRHADHMILMHRGEVVAAGRPAEVVTPARMRLAYDVEGHVVPDATGAPLFVADRRVTHDRGPG